MSAAAIVACSPDPPPSEEDGSTASTSTGAPMTTAEAVDGSTTQKLDSPYGDFSFPTCVLYQSCEQIDVLFVIDDSSTMADEQRNVARNFAGLVEELTTFTDWDGGPIDPSINLMVTTTDMGHPLCTPFQPPGYAPPQGSPVYEGCNARINRFTGLDPMDPVVVADACTEVCPVDVVPSDHFIHFDVNGTNVPNDDVAAALSCIGPQGIAGCSYEAPLEAMLRALDPTACWNDPTQPECDEDAQWADATQGFLRLDAALVVVIVSDGTDCSVAPGGDSFFTDIEQRVYWSVDPALGIKQPSPAICINAGVECTDADRDGVHESCATADSDALHSVDRYISFLDQLTEELGKDVVMLGMLGVPEVLEHNSDPPYQPKDGGVFDLVYRDWIDAPYPVGDILPAAWDAGRRAADESFALGPLAPGCIGTDEDGEILGHALPPVRVREVCESLNFVDEETTEEHVRCCIESICDSDYRPVIRCLMDVLSGPAILD